MESVFNSPKWALLNPLFGPPRGVIGVTTFAGMKETYTGSLYV